jgi:signal transduction histidine kinase
MIPLFNRTAEILMWRRYHSMSLLITKVMKKKVNLLIYFLYIGNLFLNAQSQNIIPSPILLFPDKEYFSINKSIYYFEDENGILSFEDISHPAFSENFILSARKSLNFGYTHSSYWVKFHLKNLDPQINDWILEIDYELLDSIDFYYQEHEGQWRSKAFGDMYPFKQREWDYRTFIIPLQLPDKEVHTYFLRFKTMGTMQFPMNISREKSFLRKLFLSESYYGIFFGIMILLIIYNAFVYFSLRDTTYFHYIILILSTTILVAFLSGHIFQYVLGDYMWWSNKLLPSSIALSEFCIINFTRSFLNTKKLYARLDKVLIFLLVLSFIMIFLLFFTNFHFSIQVTAYTSQLYILICLLSGVLCLLKGNKAALLFILAFTLFLIGALAISFIAIGIIGENPITSHGMELGVMLNGVFLSLALINSYKISKLEKEKAHEEILQMRQKANEQLEQKVKERTAEIQEKNEVLRQQQEELKTINELLENQKKELQLTIESLKLTQSQLVQSEKMASIGQLVAGIAHEINNPVTFISAGVDSLNTNLEEVRQVIEIYDSITQDNAGDKLKEIKQLKEEIEYQEAVGEIDKLIDSVRTGSERTTEIVKGLRTFSRLDEDVLKIADIHEGLDSTLILLRNKYKERIEIEKQYGDIPEIECYPGQLNQVFMNILSNAIDAIDDKGTITISTSKSNGTIRVSIKDSGRGIPENIQSKIFEPFFTTKEVGQGTGLGLSICHSIIEKHHGSIEVKSKVGNGSEFVIGLPVKQSIK